MPVRKDEVKEAFDLNERNLELLVSETITEPQAFLLFVDPGVTSDDSPPTQGWHRVFPPLPVTDDILAFLRERGHHLYVPAFSSQPTVRFHRREAVRRQVDALQQRGTPPSLSARRRAREAVRQ